MVFLDTASPDTHLESTLGWIEPALSTIEHSARQRLGPVQQHHKNSLPSFDVFKVCLKLVVLFDQV